jgi:hypothetical protein
VFRATLHRLNQLDSSRSGQVYNLLRLGDAYFELTNHQQSLHHYLIAGAIETSFFTRILANGTNKPFDYHSSTLKRMTLCCLALKGILHALCSEPTTAVVSVPLIATCAAQQTSRQWFCANSPCRPIIKWHRASYRVTRMLWTANTLRTFTRCRFSSC